MSFQSSTLRLPYDLPDDFEVPESTFFPNETNYIRLESQAECGATGYSNAVSYTYRTGPGCVRDAFVAMLAFGTDGSGDLSIGSGTAAQQCPVGSLFHVYFRPEGGGATFRLTQTPLAAPRLVLYNQPAGAGHGSYWLTRVDPVTRVEGTPGPTVIVNDRISGADLLGTPGQPTVNPQYVVWDHLGSTRLLTDEKGVELYQWKGYPFGLEAWSSGFSTNRKKFTGHERDEAIGLDYMLARYHSPSLGRFLSVDPGFDVQYENPQSWNLYSYVRNNPLRLVDPTGANADMSCTTGENGSTNCTVTANIAIFTDDPQMNSKELLKAADDLKKSIESAWSGSYEGEDGQVTITTVANVVVVGSEDQGNAAFDGNVHNVLKVTSDGVFTADGRGDVTYNHIDERRGWDFLPWVHGITHGEIQANSISRYGGHEFGHMLGRQDTGRTGSFMHADSVRLGLTPKPGARDFEETFGSRPESTFIKGRW